jgi:hypothetical protein
MLIIDDNLLINTAAAQSNTFSSQSQFNSESSLLPFTFTISSLINSCEHRNVMK